jgi:hypothetical protein
MGNVPAIPESTRSSITLRILLHAKEHWPQLGRLEVTCRGGFAYAAASPSGDDKPHPLFRLRYGGSAHSFGFAVYSSATGRYENSVLLTGRHTGTPQEALDTAATFYTAGITGPNPDTEPPKDLRSQPLSLLFNLLLSCWFPALWRLCRRRGGWQAGGFSSRVAFRDLAFRVSGRP